MNGYDAVAQVLKNEGFEWLACFPANPLIEAVSKVGIRPIVFRQERGGIMAADGFSRYMAAKGKYGVFACQGGPGVENAFGGFAQTWADSVPIIFLPDAAPNSRADVQPTFNAVRSYATITKWASRITSPDQIVPQMRRALSALKNGRPGPVLLEMPRIVMDQEASVSDYATTASYKNAPSQSDIKDAVKNLLAANRPLIWAGQGTLYAGATDELKELAELCQIPVLTTMPGKSAIDERHPLALGAANRTAPKAVWTWLKESDTMFAVGSSLSVTSYGIDVPAGKFLIHNSNNVQDINKEYPTAIGLYGDAKLTLRMMIDEVKAQIGEQGRRSDTSQQEAVAQVKQEWMTEWAPLLTSDMLPINPYRLVAEIGKAVDHENTVLTHDAGHPRDQIMPFYTATVPHSYIGWGKSTHLGYGIGLMIGTKMAQPDKFCVNFMGDAAFGMAGLDIETAVRSGNPITTIVLNNQTMGGYNRTLPNAMEQFGAGNMTGDYAKIAEGLGAVGIKVEKPEEIGPAIHQARKLNAEGRCALVDVKTQQELKFSIYK